MKYLAKTIWIIGFLVFAVSGIVLAQEDKPGCNDHPMFTRMPEYYIYSCEQKDFEVHEFVDPSTKQKVSVEGRYFFASYYLKKEFKGKKSMLEVARNYTNAIDRIGGVSLIERPNARGHTWMKLKKDGKEIWAHIDQDNWGGNTFYIYIVEKAVMKQQVVADAKSLMNDIQAKGSASVYGIYFDFDKADIKPESEPAIKEIAKLLQENKELKLYVVGHTDNVGSLDYNLKLSKARADAVVRELTTRYNISPDRLKAFGIGSLAPVASNRTEEGRAKNRRVELVEQ